LAFLLALLDLYLELGGTLPMIGRKKREISGKLPQQNLLLANDSFPQPKKSLFVVQVSREILPNQEVLLPTQSSKSLLTHF
jgi:hypothetical protein